MDETNAHTGLALLYHRVDQLEKAHVKLTEEVNDELEPRLRALEISHARIIGWAAGGAFIGGLVWNIVSKFML